jgi:hypothetical protein
MTVTITDVTPQLPSYFLGLDLGQAKDYTALVILERHGYGQQAIFHVRHLQRYPLGTPYPEIVEDVAAKLQLAPLNQLYPELAVDGTGVGAPVVDLFERAGLRALLRPVIITGGDEEQYAAGTHRVPKRNLVGAVQVVLQTGRLKIASALPDAAVLRRELENFQVKITTAAHDAYGAWREGQHDDLVLALALAVWAGQLPAGPGIVPSASYKG